VKEEASWLSLIALILDELLSLYSTFLTYRFILDKFNRRLGESFFTNNFSKRRNDG